MNRLPVLSGRELIKILVKVDFYVHHQTGSHIVLKNTKDPSVRISVPNHKAIKRGLLGAIIEQAGLTREEFLSLIEK
jgi:predicted RNA binding protein YcfA (HicA-like mRNA interferase family)